MIIFCGIFSGHVSVDFLEVFDGMDVIPVFNVI